MDVAIFKSTVFVSSIFVIGVILLCCWVISIEFWGVVFKMERIKKHSCPGSLINDFMKIDKDVDKENSDHNKLADTNNTMKNKVAPPTLEWLQKTLRRSRSDYHGYNPSEKYNFVKVIIIPETYEILWINLLV